MAIGMGMRIGVKPTGPDGRYTRGDHLRGAGLAAGVVVGLVVVSGIAAAMGDGKLSGIYAGVFVGCMLGILLAGASCLMSLLRAAIGR